MILSVRVVLFIFSLLLYFLPLTPSQSLTDNDFPLYPLQPFYISFLYSKFSNSSYSSIGTKIFHPNFGHLKCILTTLIIWPFFTCHPWICNPQRKQSLAALKDPQRPGRGWRLHELSKMEYLQIYKIHIFKHNHYFNT